MIFHQEKYIWLSFLCIGREAAPCPKHWRQNWWYSIITWSFNWNILVKKFLCFSSIGLVDIKCILKYLSDSVDTKTIWLFFVILIFLFFHFFPSFYFSYCCDAESSTLSWCGTCKFGCDSCKGFLIRWWYSHTLLWCCEILCFLIVK